MCTCMFVKGRERFVRCLFLPPPCFLRFTFAVLIMCRCVCLHVAMYICVHVSAEAIGIHAWSWNDSRL